jgi:hypothetical protein
MSYRQILRLHNSRQAEMDGHHAGYGHHRKPWKMTTPLPLATEMTRSFHQEEQGFIANAHECQGQSLPKSTAPLGDLAHTCS